MLPPWMIHEIDRERARRERAEDDRRPVLRIPPPEEPSSTPDPSPRGSSEVDFVL